LQVEELVSAGLPPSSTAALPGTHGAGVFGTQGAGVKNTGGGRTVAGFAGLLQVPNVGIFTIGLLSIIVASGPAPPNIVVCEFTIKVAGAVPNGHIMFAPMLAQIAIIKSSFLVFANKSILRIL
jgi:hypothetical protein